MKNQIFAGSPQYPDEAIYQRVEKARAAISLGSNLGDRAGHLLRALRALINGGIAPLACSEIYQTAPVDYLDQPPFLNQVLVIGGTLPPPLDLLKMLLAIETALGRERIIAKGPRTIDLDLLFYDELIGSSQQGTVELILPHPRMHERRFVLVPLAELLPERIHPLLKRSYREILAQLPDNAVVECYRD